ncbi:hypothetical protein EJV47_09465 [Hymenobacter gummosus]|uniref:DUF1772 domain-containing protein n=1 Tax=Hymenobacter gummosus TaxID=1776032 RepID=A0A3S0JF92_9BACT|nr:hypothetical protein [Hymenobacter gummosus]RTQ50835.1 hypothetical protein EJV47_09465 [Hymenobacter gummosus]
MNASYSPARWLFPAYLALTLYCLLAAVLTEWQGYRSLSEAGSFMNAADLAAWNMADSGRSWFPFTLPAVLLTLVVLALMANRPPAIPRGLLGAVLACHLLAWGVYLLGFAPLTAWWSQNDMVNLLIHSDWVRKLALLVEVPLALYMAYRFYGPALAAPLRSGRNTPAIG